MKLPLRLPSAALALSIAFSSPTQASSSELEEALDLMVQMHADHCEQQKLRGQLLLAHQSHDQDTMNDLYAHLDTLNKRLKPNEDKFKRLKSAVQKNPEDNSAFESAMLKMGNCGD